MSFSAKPRPPGPKRLPIVGSVLDLSRDPIAFWTAMASHGPLAYTSFGRMPIYMVSSPELVEELLIGRYRECIKDAATREMIPLMGEGLITSEGEVWKRQRKLASPTLSPRHIAGYADVMVSATESLLASFRTGETRDIHADMMTLALDIVCKTLFGFDGRSETDRVAKVVEASQEYLELQIRSWRGAIPKWVPTRDRIAFRRAVKDINQIMQGVIDRCRRDGAEADHLLARLVAARHDNGEAMSDAQVRDEGITMLLAGHETSALLLGYALHLLAQRPDAAARVREELHAKVGAQRLKVADLAQLPYLDAVVRETLRLYPPVWIFGREVVQPFELAGYTIPRGAQVAISSYVMQRDARRFPEPDRFMPERWLPGRGEPLPRFGYFPFGGGNRVCIGNHFATMEAQLVLGTLLSQFELTAVPGFELALAPSLTLRPKSGIPVQLHRLPEYRRHSPAQAALVV